MATNHHAMIRYQTIDRCLSNRFRKYFIDDLVRECCDALYNYSGIVDGVKKRQVWKDIAYMESPEGWSAPIEHIKDGSKVFLRYSDPDFSINKQPMSVEEANKLRETLFMLSRFKGMPQFEWIEEMISHLEDSFNLKGHSRSVIGFDQNLDYTATRHLAGLFNAIVNRLVLHIDYRRFDGQERNWTIHPYYIKQYNNRWFLFGLNADKNVITNIPLDRIIAYSPVQTEYIDTDRNFEEYFDDVIGVTIKDEQPETIRLKFAPQRFPYVVSKPLHMSMKIVDRENGIVEINVIPNPELEQLIFSFGHHVEVLSPQWYRDMMKERINELVEKYK